MNPENPLPPTRGLRAQTSKLLLFVGVFVLGGLILPNIRVSWREPVSEAQGTGLGVAPGPPPAGLSEAESYARAAQAASPAVVNIDTQQRVRSSMFDDDWMFGERPPQYQTMEGSGVIVDKNGYILTNAHVVGSANEAGKKILVTLADGRKFSGKVVGSDATTDVALVKVDGGGNLPTAKMGTVRGLVPGQMVVAIGNPLSFKFTVTHGVVSATARPIKDYDNMVQTDCAINPGNSGGALVNLSGQVIGINTLIISQAQGLGFAIPIDTALRVADELKRYGRVKRPWLGLSVVTNTAPLAARFDLPNLEGVVVAQLFRGGPGVSAGVEQGDVITRVNGQPVKSTEDYKSVEKSLKIGQKISLEVHRGSQFANIKAVAGEAP